MPKPKRIWAGYHRNARTWTDYNNGAYDEYISAEVVEELIEIADDFADRNDDCSNWERTRLKEWKASLTSKES